MNSVLLETPRLLLEIIPIDGYDLMYDLDSNPRVTKYTGQSQFEYERYPKVIKRIYLKNYLPSNFRKGYFYAFLKENHQFIGWFHLREDLTSPNSKDLEIGYRLKEPFWNQGYASEGTKYLMAYAFENLDIDSLFAVAFQENLPSRRVLEKNGFIWVKDFIEDGMELVEYRCFKKSDI